MNTNDTYTELIIKALCGEASEAELQELESWKKADVSNQKAFDDLAKTWSVVETKPDPVTIDVSEAWNKLELEIDAQDTANETPVIPISHSFKRVWQSAAAIIIIIGGIAISQLFNQGAGVTLTAEQVVLQDSLLDESFISLHPGAELKLADNFNETERRVALTGKAHFSVARNEAKPFIIDAGHMQVEVLGTKFTVNACQDCDQMEVVVTSGKVAVRDPKNPSEEVILTKGQSVTFNKETHKLNQVLPSETNYDSWMTGVLRFENAALKDVVSTVSKYYNRPIQLANKNLNDCRVTVTFDNQPIQEVIQVLEKTLKLSTENKNDTVVLNGEGC